LIGDIGVKNKANIGEQFGILSELSRMVENVAEDIRLCRVPIPSMAWAQLF
jgi:hypothetical protein